MRGRRRWPCAHQAPPRGLGASSSSVVAAGLAIALSEGRRKAVLDTLFGKEEEFEYTSTTTPSPEPAAAGAS